MKNSSKKTDIVLASVLKPADDPRMFEKLGKTLADSGRYFVHSIGFQSTADVSYPNIKLYPIFKFNRLSLKRVVAGFRLLKLLFRLKPKFVVAGTFEILPVCCIYKLFSRKTKLIYDVRENYYRNLIYSNVFPSVIKHLLAVYVRIIELKSSLFISHYLAAEQCYPNEMKFIRKKCTVIENKYSGSTPTSYPERGVHRLLYTGSISEHYGIFEAIDLGKKLHAADSQFSLKIVGYCSKDSVLKQIHHEISGCNFIQLTGGNQLVPHKKIIEAIKAADIGLLSYRPLKNAQLRIPTKFYEYASHRLPMIIQNNSFWESLSDPYPAGIFIDFNDFNAENLIVSLQSAGFYAQKTTGDLLWESEKEKLLVVFLSQEQ